MKKLGNIKVMLIFVLLISYIMIQINNINAPKVNVITPLGVTDKPFTGGALYFTKMIKEEWKIIKEFPNYKISNYGKVLNITRNKLLKPLIQANERLYVRLYGKNKKSRNRFISRLIAIEFIPNPENKRTVNHKNGIKTDNRIKNLEWMTHGENTKHGYALGLIKPAWKNINGRNNPSSKPIIQFDKEKNLINEFDSMSLAEIETGIFCSNISLVCNGIRKYAGGYIWEFKIKKS